MRWVVGVFAAVIFLSLFAVGAPGQEVEPAPVEEAEMITLTLTGNVQLRALLDYVQRQTGKSFVLEQNTLTEKVEILPGGKIRKDGLYTFFESVLALKGYVLVPSTGGWINVVKVPAAGVAKKPMPLLTPQAFMELPETDAVLTVAYPLEHIGSQEVITTLRSLAAAADTVIALARSNIILLTDYATNLRRLVTIISMMDDERYVPEWQVFPLEYASADILAAQLLRLLRAEAAAVGADKARQTAYVDFDLGTNSLIALATEPTMEKIEGMIEVIDIEPEAGARNIKNYPLKNAKAKDLQTTLEQLTQYQPPSGVRPVPGARQPSGPSALGQLGLGPVKIIANESTNSIVVMAPPEIQSDIKALIEELDGQMSQVLIEALIVQVISGDDLDIGVELASWGRDGIGVTSFGFSEYDFATGARTINEGLGLTGAVVNNDQIPILLRALLTNNKGQIISRPRLLVSDHKEAEFESLDQSPYTSLSTVTTTTATTTFGGYADAGTKLKIIPHIGDGGYIVLELELEISRFTGAAVSESVPPPKRTDSLKSWVEVPDKSTIVIGGLSGYHVVNTIQKVPLLGDIPLLGHLFRRTIRSLDDGTEYIFIKAHIADDKDFADLKAISEGPKKEADAIERELVGEKALQED